MTARQRSWLLPPAVLALIAGILLGRNTPSPALALVACLPVLATVLLGKGLLRFAACLVLSLAVGVAAGSLAWHPSLPPEADYDVQGVISDEIRSGHFGQVRIKLTHVTLNGREHSGGAYWTFYLSDDEELPAGLEPGKFVSFRAGLYYPSGSVNPDGYDFREELLRDGIDIGLYGQENLEVSDPPFFSFPGMAASLRHRLTEMLIDRMGEETGGYTAALLFGQRSLIPSEDRDAFSKLGIAHLLSVSGFHVGILVGLLALLFRLLHPRPVTRLVLYAVILAAYCALCGMNPPVVRASLLLLVSLGGKILNRPRTGLHAVCAVLYVMLLWSPVQLTGVSFLLTFSAVLGLTLVTPGIMRHNPFRRRLPRWLWDSAAVVFGAQLGILLPELWFFQKLPLLGFIISIPATAYASALIALDWITLLLLPVPGLSGLLASLASAATSLLTGLVRNLSALPGISLWAHAPNGVTVLGILLVATALCALLRLSRKTRGCLLAAGVVLTVVSLLPMPHTSTEYIQFSAGNADAAVLWDQDRVIVIDTGTDDGILSTFLRRRRLTPDAVVLTHLHSDHAGGLRSMLDDEIPVPLLLLPAGAEEQLVHEDITALLAQLRASGTEIRYLGKGDELSLPSGSLSVLWPENGKTRPGQDANRYSLVSLITLKGVTLLQSGDISGEYEMYSAVPADLLKAPHHGSSSSSSEAYLDAVDPQAVLLSCKSESRHLSYAERLSPDTVLWSTARSGALTLRFDEGRVAVIPYLQENTLSPESAR